MNNKISLREKLGKRASIVGIIANIVLSIGKIVTGFLCGLISVVADGFNNLSDCGSSVVSLISFKMASKPADKEHPYGHERIEYISSLAVGFIILLIAFELVKESIGKIISGEIVEFSVVAIIIMSLSILIKLFMFVYYKAVSKKIDSNLLNAAAIDSISDCFATAVVVISILLSKFLDINIDGYAGVMVAILIAIAGFRILKEMISKLIGQAPDKQMFEDVKERILKYTDVLGIHDLNIYSYGPNKYFASVHIEIDANTDSLAAHELIDDIEREFQQNTNILLTGHHDPIVVDDDEVNIMREKVKEIALSIDENFMVHDFRMVKGSNKTNVIFEVAIPFESDILENKIIEIMTQKITEIDKKYKPVIMVEKQMYIK